MFIYTQIYFCYFSMTEILVLKAPEVIETTYNKTEQEIKYDKFRKVASLPEHHYDNFSQMETQEFQNQDIKTSLVSIQIKSIINYVRPIIRRIPAIKLKTKKVDIFRKTKIVEERTRDKCYNIPIQLEYPI